MLMYCYRPPDWNLYCKNESKFARKQKLKGGQQTTSYRPVYVRTTLILKFPPIFSSSSFRFQNTRISKKISPGTQLVKCDCNFEDLAITKNSVLKNRFTPRFHQIHFPNPLDENERI